MLASDCKPVERIIKETSAGVIYRYDDTTELAKIIEHILNDDSYINEPGGKEWVINKYNWSRDREQLKALYRYL